jgi:catechol 2,3-dioxygenase-like lactoylglutathione lyase family enzyme
MKRLHVHVAVDDLDDSIAFYRGLFGVEPTVRRPDYAKWRLDDPPVNLALSTGGGKRGLDHLGLEVDSSDELEGLRAQMTAAGVERQAEGEALCCYARSDKTWAVDPEGLRWESFHTTGTHDALAGGAPEPEAARGCCGPSGC